MEVQRSKNMQENKENKTHMIMLTQKLYNNCIKAKQLGDTHSDTQTDDHCSVKIYR